ncbi:hypothetical protein [Geodermatophilus normandii]|uniref:arsenate reductase/protein-tyrosine-phosphatase family protein n=1 Tax=Geodermatophilus normandii TaxID=1137989 RepID=UPI001B8856FE|nr:hypothetical protein [Geodermatophilus normandii]
MPRLWPSTPVFGVLLVCTGNVCRSPLAERLGRAYLEAASPGSSRWVDLGSAGTRAVVGAGMHPHSALVLQGLGGDPSGFLARQLTGPIADAADLTLTMTREHRRDVLAVAPRALSRTYTLREAADLLGLVGDNVSLGGASSVDRARDLVERMAARRPLRRSGPDDDIRDPIGQPAEVHQEVGDSISEALLTVLGRLVSWGSVTGGVDPAPPRAARRWDPTQTG